MIQIRYVKLFLNLSYEQMGCTKFYYNFIFPVQTDYGLNLLVTCVVNLWTFSECSILSVVCSPGRLSMIRIRYAILSLNPLRTKMNKYEQMNKIVPWDTNKWVLPSFTVILFSCSGELGPKLPGHLLLSLPGHSEMSNSVGCLFVSKIQYDYNSICQFIESWD